MRSLEDTCSKNHDTHFPVGCLINDSFGRYSDSIHPLSPSHIRQPTLHRVQSTKTQWFMTKCCLTSKLNFTAAGTVTGLHGIPY